MNKRGQESESRSTPGATVIVPVHNDAGTLGTCLASILPEIRAEGWELIVVDDASTDYSAWIADMAGARVIRLEENIGVAGARNAGGMAAQAEILIFLDADIVPTEGALKAMVDTLTNRTEVHAVGAYPTPRDLSNFWSGHFVGLRSAWGYHWDRNESERNFSSIQSECGAIRRSVFLEMGGFPEIYRGVGMEEFQMAHELEGKGYGHLLLRSASYDHHYKTLWRRCLALFNRTTRWVPLLIKRKKFESRGAVGTADAAFSCFLTALAFAAVVTGFILPPAFFAAAVIWLIQVALEFKFFRFAAANYGRLMIPYGFFALQALHLAIGLGFIRGLWRLLLRRRSPANNCRARPPRPVG